MKCVYFDNIDADCEVQFWSTYDKTNQICLGDLQHTESGPQSGFQFAFTDSSTTPCVAVFCGIDSTKVWDFNPYQSAGCSDPSTGFYTGVGEVTTCTQFEGFGLESVFFHPYMLNYELHIFSDSDCTAAEDKIVAGCLTGVDDRPFYKFVAGR